MKVARETLLLVLLLCTSCSRSHYAELCDKVDGAGPTVLLADARSLVASIDTKILGQGRRYVSISPITNSLAVFGASARVYSNRVSFTTAGLGGFRMGITFIVDGSTPQIVHWSTRNTGEGYHAIQIYPKEYDQ